MERVKIPVTICMSISKQFELDVKENESLYDAIDQYVLPNDLSLLIQKAVYDKLIINNTYWLNDALRQCSNWNIDDFQIIPDE